MFADVVALGKNRYTYMYMSENSNPTLNSTWQPAPNTQASTAPFAAGLQKENSSMKAKKIFVPALVGVIVLGLGTGLVAAKMTAPAKVITTTVQTGSDTSAATGTTTTQTTVKEGQVFGAKDASAFKDSVEGVLVAGGIGGEGSHHILRAGGASQSVYLTSSVVDLKMFEGAKVKVSGETFKGQKAGWLMDVGRVEVEQLNAPLPDGAKAPAVVDGGGE